MKTLQKTSKAMLMLALMTLCFAGSALAAVSVTTAASGGSNISADNAANSTSPSGGSWTTLGNAVITEGNPNDFAQGTGKTFVINAPTGWKFNTGATVTVTSSGGGNALTGLSATVSATSITITYTASNSSTYTINALTISGIQVKANTGSPLPQSGNMTTATGTGTISGINGLTVSSLSETFGALASFAVSSTIGTQTAGTSFSMGNITAQDQFGNTVTSFTSTATITTSAGSGLTVPSGGTTGSFVLGVLTAPSVTLTKSGSQSLTVTGGGKSGTTNSFNVNALGLNSFSVSAIGTQTAGTPFNIGSITAIDIYGNTVTSYTGTVTITTSAGSGLAAPSGGVTGTFSLGVLINQSVTLTKSGNQYLTVSGGSKSGTSNTFTVNSATLNSFSVSTTLGTQTAGTAFNMGSITALDVYGNIVTSFNTTATISTSASSGLTSPAGGTSGTFVGGVLSSQNVTLTLSGSQSLTVTSGGKTGTTNSFTVNPGALNSFSVSNSIGTQTAGTAFNMGTITAQDAYGNTVTSFIGTVTISTSAGTGLTAPTGGTSGSFVGGVLTSQSVTLTKSGSQTLTVTSGGKSGTSNTFTVNPASLSALSISLISSPQPVDANFTSSVTISGFDYYGNPVNGGTVTFTTTAGTITPASATFSSAGTVTISNFKVTASGTGQTITATSSGNFVSSNPFTVSPFASSTSDYFRSNGSGDWASTSPYTWQGSHDGTNWYTATAYPTSAATSITVQSGHTVSISTSVSSSNLSISGVVNVNSSGNLSNSGTITGATTTTLVFNSGGEYTHAQDGGTIPTATWNAASICNITGVTNNVPGGLSQSFGSYIWNCSSQASSITSAIPATINGNLTISSTSGSYITIPSTVTVAGNFTLSGGSLEVYQAFEFGSSTTTGTLNIAGNFTMSGGTLKANTAGAFFGSANAVLNIVFDGTSTQTFVKTGGTISVTNATGLATGTATNNFTINSGATVDFSTYQLDGTANFTLSSGAGILTGNAYGLTSSTTGSTGGSIVVTGTRSYNAGANYTYSGSVAQATGNGLPTTLSANLTINNSSSTGVTLSQATTLNGNLYLNNGLLTTTATNLLSMGSSSTANLAVSDYTNTSYINGPLQKTGNTAFTFPVGKSGTGYVPIAITSTSASQIFRAEYIHSSAAALGSIASGSTLTAVSGCDYWNLNLYNGSGTQIPTMTSGSIGVTLFWNANNSCNAITNLSYVNIGHYGSSTGWDVIAPGAPTINTGSTTSDGSVTFLGTTNFSPFALSTYTPSSALPVILSGFTATLNNNKTVGLDWTTQQETNVSHYEVERSADGNKWETIATVNAKGNSDIPTAYLYIDQTPLQGANYYRIKMMDDNGNFGYTVVRAVNVLLVNGVHIYPNPARDYINITVSQSSSDIQVMLVNQVGQVLQTGKIQAGSSTLTMTVTNYPQGTYFIQLKTADGSVQTSKVLIMR